MKKADTPTMIELMEDADRREYNRRLITEKLVPDLDPDGIHIIRDWMMHEHKAGVLCEPHVRCQVYLRMKGTYELTEGFLDIELERFNRLDDAPTSVEGATNV